MKVDELSSYSREFYEHALLKQTISIMFAAFGMMLLGFSASSGGNSAGDRASSSQAAIQSKSVFKYHCDHLYFVVILKNSPVKSYF